MRSAWHRQLEESGLREPSAELISTQAFEDEINHLHDFIEQMSVYLEGCMTSFPKQEIVSVSVAPSTFAIPGQKGVSSGGGPSQKSKRASGTSGFSLRRINSLLRSLPRKYETGSGQSSALLASQMVQEYE